MEETRSRLSKIRDDPVKYKPLLQSLITQGLCQMLDPEVVLVCRKEDVPAVKVCVCVCVRVCVFGCVCVCVCVCVCTQVDILFVSCLECDSSFGEGLQKHCTQRLYCHCFR